MQLRDIFKKNGDSNSGALSVYSVTHTAKEASDGADGDTIK